MLFADAWMPLGPEAVFARLHREIKKIDFSITRTVASGDHSQQIFVACGSRVFTGRPGICQHRAQGTENGDARIVLAQTLNKFDIGVDPPAGLRVATREVVGAQIDDNGLRFPCVIPAAVRMIGKHPAVDTGNGIFGPQAFTGPRNANIFSVECPRRDGAIGEIRVFRGGGKAVRLIRRGHTEACAD